MNHPHKSQGRRSFLGMTAAALAMPGLALAGRGETETITGKAFGTFWRITGPSGRGIARLRSPVERLLADIDRQMSPWRPDSELARFNLAGTGSFRVSPETARVSAAALALARDSGGRFDPSVGPLVARWGFGPIRGDERPGWHGLSAGGGRLTKTRPGLTIDICGIAKGWALDQVSRLAAAFGHDSLLIDLGGELAATGRHPSGRDWQVAIEHPEAADGRVAAVIGLKGQAVATSGLRAQSYRLGSREYGHVIDPFTREPVRGNLLSVSVVAADAMTADGWATALFAAGEAAGPDLARRHGLAAMFLGSEGRDLRVETTGSMAGLLL